PPYGGPATTSSPARVPRLRTSDSPSLIPGWPGTGCPPAGSLGLTAPFPASSFFSRVARTPLAFTSTPRTVTPCLRTSLIRLAGAVKAHGRAPRSAGGEGGRGEALRQDQGQ